MIAIVKLINLGSGYRSHILTEKVTKCLLGPNVSDRSVFFCFCFFFNFN